VGYEYIDVLERDGRVTKHVKSGVCETCSDSVAAKVSTKGDILPCTRLHRQCKIWNCGGDSKYLQIANELSL
jgi:hypothetical protein